MRLLVAARRARHGSLWGILHTSLTARSNLDTSGQHSLSHQQPDTAEDETDARSTRDKAPPGVAVVVEKNLLAAKLRGDDSPTAAKNLKLFLVSSGVP